MADREKIISNFEHEVNKAHGEGWDFVDLSTEDAKDILDMLKEQKARVMTLEEVLSQEWDYVYIETEHRPYSKEIEAYCGTHTIYCSTTVVHKRQTSGDSEYGKTWRCWTARPTDEQREATPWNT